MSKQLDFINKVAPYAVDGWREGKILPSITIAQACLESGWGGSTLAREACNFYGIKAKADWKGARYTVKTAEYRKDGSKFYIYADFRKYKNLEESTKDHTLFFTSTEWRRNNYKDFIGKSNYKEALAGLQKSGYATSPIYSKQLQEIIEKYNLTKWDKIALQGAEGGSKAMNILITVGHSILAGGTCTSASGYINEYKYNKALAPYIKKELEKLGHKADVLVCPERVFKSAREERTYKLPRANNGKYNLVCELHLNASNGRGNGTEVFYYKGDSRGKAIANRYCRSMAALGFRNRGGKNAALYMVNETKPLAVLLESFFCDNKADCDRAKKLGYNAIAKVIAEALVGADRPVAKKEECVMYLKDGNKSTAEAIAMLKGIPCYRDNGKDLPNKEHSKWDILYIGNLGKDRQDTCRKAFKKFLNF